MHKFTILMMGWLGIGFGLQAQPVQDDFEGNGTIHTWAEDGLTIDTRQPNPLVDATNPSATVLKYHDTGGQYANVRFDVPANFDLSIHHTFTLKIYVPAGGLTGSAPNQVSLKLQNGTLSQPWLTQCEVIKPINLDQWQSVSFDFMDDSYVNFDPGSGPPTQRQDFNRVLIQVNGENNSDHVLAYIDDVEYDGIIDPDTGVVFPHLVWSDEFDGTGQPDTSKWFHETVFPNGNSWWGGEVQYYTDRLENSFVQNGALHIHAKKETFTDKGVTKEYTSARLNSKFAFTYGRVEVKAKVPAGPGTLPAIWMLGQSLDDVGYWQTQGHASVPWPACGEIDIMEHWGANENHVSSATHTPSSFGATVNVGGQFVPNATTAFHVYSLDWTSEKLVFAVDDSVHFIYQPGVKDSATWPFDAPMYILLNTAILPTIDSSFSENTMEIDYVRVYQEDAPTSLSPLQEQNITVYPNPVHEVLYLRLPATEVGKPLTFSIYDLSGRLQQSYRRSLTQPEVSLPQISDLAAGIYLMHIKGSTRPQALRFVKQ